MDRERVIHELTQGKEFAKQLMMHLHNPSSSIKSQEILMHNILHSYEKSLSLLMTTCGINPMHAAMGITQLDLQQVSLSESPCSQDADHEVYNLDHKDLDAKRKKWKNQVKVREGMGFEEAVDDGYSWRKYGQKDILGAKNPRGYYRCTYRQEEGCLATKQVQKTNEHPSIIDITYHGSHTCNPELHTSSTLSSPQKQVIQSHEPFLTNKQDLQTFSFHFASTSNNIFDDLPLDNTYLVMSQPQANSVEKQPTTTVFESQLNDVVLATTSSHSVEKGFSFGDMGFGNNFSFDDSMFYD